MVPEALPIEDDEIETTPVEVEIVKSKDDVAPPPSCPKRICESTPEERMKAVEVAYLLPLKSRMLVTAVKVPIVEEGVRSSVEETTPSAKTFPDASTLNFEDEFTWRSRKLPVKVEVVLIPM